VVYVLVHGAWHGSWCWNKVVPLLQAKGHRVFTPDLPGHYRNSVSCLGVTLKTYVDSISNFIVSKNDKIVLVGHSMAGVVISQVAENIPERIEKLVYLSAFIPDNNGSLVQEEAKKKVPSVAKEIIIDDQNNEIALKLSPRIAELFYGDCSVDDQVFALRHLQKQPLHPFVDTVALSQDRFGNVPKVYIECLEDQAISIGDQRRMHAKIQCEVLTLSASHSPFFSMPEALVGVLCDCC
jgi:pimeloyl-ACP methyl ester carboxylesterase